MIAHTKPLQDRHKGAPEGSAAGLEQLVIALAVYPPP